MSTMVAGPAYYNSENSGRHPQTLDMGTHEPENTHESSLETLPDQDPPTHLLPEHQPENGHMMAVVSAEFCPTGHPYTPPPISQPQGPPTYCAPEFYPGDAYYPGPPPVPDYCQHHSMCAIHGVPGGPATVRMVSTNSSPPIPLPVQMPPGHIVQQIVDETGTLQHVILSTQPMAMPVCPYGPNGNQGPHQFYSPPPGSHPPQGYIPPYQPTQYSPVMSPSLAQTASPPPHTYQKHERNSRHHDKARHKFNPRHGHPNQIYPGQQHQKTCNSIHTTPPLSPQKEILKKSDHSEDQINGTDGPEPQIILKQLLGDVQAVEVSDVTAYGAAVQWKSPDISSCPLEALGKGILRYEIFLGNHFHTSSTNTHINLNNLLPGTEYRVHFICICNSIRGKSSPAKSFQTKAARPEPPQPPRLIERTKNSLFFRWYNPKDNGAKITHYTIEVSGGDYADWTEVYQHRNKQYSIQKLKPQTIYKLRLAAVNEIGKSSYSAEISESTSGLCPSQPVPPSLAESTVNSLTLSWDKRPIDESFTLQMDDPFNEYGFRPVFNGRDTIYMCVDLKRNSDYKFRLCSQNLEGSSPFSSIVSYATLPDRPAPPAAPSVKGKAHHDRLTATWSEPLDMGGSSVTNYQLEIDKGNGYEIVYTGTHLEHEITDLIPGRNYRARCLAESPGGKSVWSREGVLCTKSIVPYQCPSPKPLGKPKATTLQLRWAAPDFNGGTAIIEFHLDMVSPSSERKQVYCGHDTECTIASLLPGRSYIFLLRAVNKVGFGPWSEPTEVISGAGPPEAPRVPTLATKGPQVVMAVWDEPINNGAGIRQYTVQCAEMMNQNSESSECSEPESELVFNTVYTGPNNTAEIRNLTPATTYAIRVSASNVTGMGQWSAVTSVTTAAAAPAVISHVSSEPTCHEITLHWNEPACHGDPILYYEIEISDRLICTEKPCLVYTIDKLEAETTYKIRIKSVNNVGSGPLSSYHRVTTDTLPPNAPKVELLKASYNSLRLKWGDGKNYDLLKYSLQMEFLNSQKSMEFFQIYNGTNQNFKVGKLEENTIYKFRLSASNEAGTGAYSEHSEFTTTKAPPQTPKAPRVTESQSGTYCVEWCPLRCPTDDKITYKMQLMQVGNDKDYVQAYSGPEQSHILTDLAAERGFYVRVCGVRTCADGDVMAGAYSSPVYFSTPKAALVDADAVSVSHKKEAAFQWKKLSDQEKAFAMVLLFSVIAFLAAYVVSPTQSLS